MIEQIECQVNFIRAGRGFGWRNGMLAKVLMQAKAGLCPTVICADNKTAEWWRARVPSVVQVLCTQEDGPCSS